MIASVFAATVHLTYNFTTTKDRAGRDILLIGPENEDIHIGVLGRIFYPTDDTLKKREQWPVGMWTAVTCPPDDPPRYEWRYTLELNATGTVAFSETEYFQDYDENLEPRGSNRLQRILHLKGTWLTEDIGSGIIIFTEKHEEVPNQPSERAR